MGTTTVYLPYSTKVHVRGFTNASFNQRVTITPESGSATVWTGKGENDAPMGDMFIQTPDSGASPIGWSVQLKVESESDGGWQSSQVGQASCGVMYYKIQLIVSEDYVDEDWNDAVVMFTWWVPPKNRVGPSVSQ